MKKRGRFWATRWVIPILALSIAVPVFAAHFHSDQEIQVSALQGERWTVLIWNYESNTGESVVRFGPSTVDFDLPSDIWLGLFVYSYLPGKWEEAVWLYDQSL